MSEEDLKKEMQAWLIVIDESANYSRHVLSIKDEPKVLSSIEEKSLFIICNSKQEIIKIIQSFRRRQNLSTTYFYAEKEQYPNGTYSLDEFGIKAPESSSYRRLAWPDAEAIVSKTCSVNVEDLGLIQDHEYTRDLFQLAIIDDLLGPACGPHEDVVDMGVCARYLVGKLAPILRPDDIHVEGLGNPEDEEDVDPDELQVHEGRHENGAEFSKTAGSRDTEAENADEIDTTNNQSLVPSSVGLTFCISSEIEELSIEARWGRYERINEHDYRKKRKNKETGEEEEYKPRVWRRIPSGGARTIPVDEGVLSPIEIDTECPGVILQGTIRPPNANGDRLITLFLVNTQPEPDENRDTAWVFQPEISIRASESTEDKAIFRRRPMLDSDTEDEERYGLEMIYRNRVEFSVGHGISTHAILDERASTRAVEIKTTVLPEYEVGATETPGLREEDRAAMRQLVDEGRLLMSKLADGEREQIIETLDILTNDYEKWIDEKVASIEKELKEYETKANENIGKCREILQRLREGIDCLKNDDNAMQAFRFANRAMGLQRIHSVYALAKRRNEEIDISKEKPSWRPFQLAFLILNIPSLTNPLHKDRTKYAEAYADLLWFPTGGGKTEAYLGVAAFTMAMRRLQSNWGEYDASRGLGVIMRYTLRLLTIQQFQRATALICAMEKIRQKDPTIWGSTAFTIGLWVGNKVTPGTTKDSAKAIAAYRNDNRRDPASSPRQLTSCPWCGSEIRPDKDIEVDEEVGKTILYCSERKCSFSLFKSGETENPGLPVVVVDEEIYHRPPSMLIATVDKFAMMAWRGETKTMFGISDEECPRHGLLWEGKNCCNGNHQAIPAKSLSATTKKTVTKLRPPDLIIQDEFHLISGPLGTMVGLYETAVDELCTWLHESQPIRPKIIASTATVRKATEQMHNVFLRRASIFPPSGLEVEDNFFSVQRSLDKKFGRRYVGICSPGSSRPSVLIRVYTALLSASQALFNRFGSVVDPYMSTVGYFNSLRELGGMKRLVEDDVQTRTYRIEMSEVRRPGLAQRSLGKPSALELTSRVSSQRIPGFLDQLENTFQSTYDSETAMFKVVKDNDTPRGVDVVLATNMLSVGVDVNRLGLMAVNGQPKGTAEYIQSTSRVGRQFPGIIFTVLTWARPRDLSHYETFEHYHATFYKHVEAQSVTPFSPRALDRGLTGTFISLSRLSLDEFNPNEGAGELDDVSDVFIKNKRECVEDRVWRVTNSYEIKDSSSSMLKTRIDKWHEEAIIPGRNLVYEIKGRTQGENYPLLIKPGLKAWQNFTAPQSMREVEPTVRLIMNVGSMDTNRSWSAPRRDEMGNEIEDDDKSTAMSEFENIEITPGLEIISKPPGEELARKFRFIDAPDTKPTIRPLCVVVHSELKQKGMIKGVAYGKLSWDMQQTNDAKEVFVYLKISRPKAHAKIKMTAEEWEKFTGIAICVD